MLGTLIDSSGTSKTAVDFRILKAGRCFMVNYSLLTAPLLSCRSRLQAWMKAPVASARFSCKAWHLDAAILKRIYSWEMRHLKRAFRLSRRLPDEDHAAHTKRWVKAVRNHLWREGIWSLHQRLIWMHLRDSWRLANKTKGDMEVLDNFIALGKWWASPAFREERMRWDPRNTSGWRHRRPGTPPARWDTINVAALGDFWQEGFKA